MTIKEIAKLAGVSTATVSRAINSSGYIKAEVKTKIMKIIEETGFTPSSVAQDLKRSRTNLIGVIIPKISSNSVAKIVDGISSELNKENFSILLANTNNDSSEELKYLKIFQEKRANGILLLGTIITEDHIKVIKSSNIPVIIIGQDTSAHNIPCVIQNEEDASYKITKYLLDNNHKKIAYIGTNIEDYAIKYQRKNGFLKALREYDVLFDEKYSYYTDFLSNSAYEGMKKLFKNTPDISAVFCATDSMAISAVNAMLDKNIFIPENISIVGIGNSYFGINNPKLTTISYDYFKTGIEGAKLLLRKLNDNNDFNKITMKYNFYTGGSVRKL